MLLKYLSIPFMKFISLTAILILNILGLFGQNLIGFNSEKIMKYMKDNQKEMIYNKVTNSKYSYLKYSDNSDSKTILFFLNPDSVCFSIRLICDLNGKTEKVNEFNTIYKTAGENKWIDKRDNKDYIIELKDEKWSYVISIEPDK